jgi:DNA invertase Pin-like site-specific DNA recombinase
MQALAKLIKVLTRVGKYLSFGIAAVTFSLSKGGPIMKKAVGYVRVSTVDQADNGASLDAQKAKIVAWCSLSGYSLAEVFTDRGISGKSMKNREGLQQALASMGKGDALVVYSLSRLARSTKDAIAISELLSKRGADLVSLSEQIDTTSAAGKMVFRMLSVLAEFERDLISERTKGVLAYKKANGEKYGPLPFGFVEDGGRLVEQVEETEVVAEILAMRKQGQTFLTIADTLNARNVHGKRGGRWHASSVRYLIGRQIPAAVANVAV